jgi:hypothetical protein
MHVDALRELLHTQPFAAFTIRRVDGRGFTVPHPDFVAVSPRQVLHISHENESVTRIDPRLIVTLDDAPGAGQQSPRERQREQVNSEAEMPQERSRSFTERTATPAAPRETRGTRL